MLNGTPTSRSTDLLHALKTLTLVFEKSNLTEYSEGDLKISNKSWLIKNPSAR